MLVSVYQSPQRFPNLDLDYNNLALLSLTHNKQELYKEFLAIMVDPYFRGTTSLEHVPIAVQH